MTNTDQHETLTPVEEATADAIEADFAALVKRWQDRGFPRNVVVPMVFTLANDLARQSGIKFESAIETMRMVWLGKPS
jgi:hypothetical protein